MAKKAKEKKQNQNTKDNVLNLDNEIIIGIKTLPEPKLSAKQKKQLENKKKNQRKTNNSKRNKTKNQKANKNVRENAQNIEKENSKKKSKNSKVNNNKISKNTRTSTSKREKASKAQNTRANKRVAEDNFEELEIEIPDMSIKQKPKLTAKQQEMAKKKRKHIFRIVKYTTLLAIILGGGIYFMLSPFFNIKEITVAGNEKLKSEELISLSGIQLEENTFKLRSNQIEERVKQNAYVDQVKIKRSLPDKVTIEIVERKPRFMLTFANAYVYINNQGYLLEVAQNPISVPIITGFLTPEEDIHVGNRLCTEDLQRLEHTLQIMKSAEANGIGNKVTRINIADKQDYVLELKDEKKTVHLGDSSNLSTKMLYIISIIDENKKVEGEIFVNTDLSNKGAIFRKKI